MNVYIYTYIGTIPTKRCQNINKLIRISEYNFEFNKPRQR